MAATSLLLYCRQSGLDESWCRLLLPTKYSGSSRAAASANGGALRYCGIKRCGISARSSRAALHDVSLRKLSLLLNHFRSPRAAASANGGALEEMLQMLHEEAMLWLQEMELDERLQTQSAGVLQAAVCRVLGRLEHSKKLEGGYRLVAAMRAADARREHMAGLLFGSCLCSDDGMTQMRCWLIP